MRRKPAPKMAAGWTDLDSDLFELDSVLPEQYHDHVVEWSGEQKLCAAVLADAIRLYRRDDVGVAAWIESDSAGYLYDFVCICAALNLDPATIRRRLKGAP